MNGMHEDFKYSITDSILNLETYDSNFSREYYGIRTKKENCNLEEDFYSTNEVSIELREFDEIKETANENKSSCLNIYVGTDKIRQQEAIEIGEKIINLQEIPIEYERFKLKVKKENQDQLELILNIDKHTSNQLKEELYEQIKELDYNRIYQRQKDENGQLVLTEFEFN